MPSKVPSEPQVCQHCGKDMGRYPRPRGLCYGCYKDVTIRLQYAANRKFAPWAKADATMSHIYQEPKAGPRRAGDSSHRCFWCLKWRCERIFQLCPECQDELNERLKTMPKEDFSSTETGGTQCDEKPYRRWSEADLAECVRLHEEGWSYDRIGEHFGRNISSIGVVIRQHRARLLEGEQP